jgi:hypothetical protein
MKGGFYDYHARRTWTPATQTGYDTNHRKTRVYGFHNPPPKPTATKKSTEEWLQGSPAPFSIEDHGKAKPQGSYHKPSVRK